MVEGVNDHPHGTRFMVGILDAQHELIGQQPAYLEWGVRMVDGVRREFISFCFEHAVKDLVPVDGYLSPCPLTDPGE